jgi:hypothetical protein
MTSALPAAHARREVRVADASGGAANRLSETRYNSPAGRAAAPESGGTSAFVPLIRTAVRVCACVFLSACVRAWLCACERARDLCACVCGVRACVRITRAKPGLVGAPVLCCVCPCKQLDGQTLVEIGTGYGTGPPSTSARLPPGTVTPPLHAGTGTCSCSCARVGVACSPSTSATRRRARSSAGVSVVSGGARGRANSEPPTYRRWPAARRMRVCAVQCVVLITGVRGGSYATRTFARVLYASCTFARVLHASATSRGHRRWRSSALYCTTRCAVRCAPARRPCVWTAVGPESELARQRGHGGDGAGPPQRRTGVPRRRREGIARRAVH